MNDLPLDGYCEELRRELDFLTATPPPRLFSDVVLGNEENKVLWPLSTSGHNEWRMRSTGDIRSALRAKVVIGDRSGSSSESTLSGSRKEEA